MARITYSAYADELEQMAGSCESAAKSVSDSDRDKALFLMGAAAGIDQLSRLGKPEDAYYRVIDGFPEALRRIGGDAA